MTRNNISPSYAFKYPYHKYGGMAKWTKAADCKSVILGSNPSAAFIYCLWRGGWWNGRHEGLKIPSPQGGEGSTPSPPTRQLAEQGAENKSKIHTQATVKPVNHSQEQRQTIEKITISPFVIR